MTAAGHIHRRKIRAVVGFEPDTFETIRKRATKSRVSFAEEVRTLVEWGLEA